MVSAASARSRSWLLITHQSRHFQTRAPRLHGRNVQIFSGTNSIRAGTKYAAKSDARLGIAFTTRPGGRLNTIWHKLWCQNWDQVSSGNRLLRQHLIPHPPTPNPSTTTTRATTRSIAPPRQCCTAGRALAASGEMGIDDAQRAAVQVQTGGDGALVAEIGRAHV